MDNRGAGSRAAAAGTPEVAAAGSRAGAAADTLVEAVAGTAVADFVADTAVGAAAGTAVADFVADTAVGAAAPVEAAYPAAADCSWVPPAPIARAPRVTVDSRGSLPSCDDEIPSSQIYRGARTVVPERSVPQTAAASAGDGEDNGAEWQRRPQQPGLLPIRGQ